MKVGELARILKAQWLRKVDPELSINSFSIDSRDIQRNDCFIAINGFNQDGHRFVKDVRDVVSCIVVEKRNPILKGYHTNVLYVNDTKNALKKVALTLRKTQNTCTIAITGSCGKTTTKEMLSHVLSHFYKTNSSPYSFNNEIGISLTLANHSNDMVNIIEAGINHKGEMEGLSRLLRPNIICITSIGLAHLEGLSDIQQIKNEKFKLAEHASNGAVCILPIDLAEDFKAKYPNIRIVSFGDSKDADIVLEQCELGYNMVIITVNGRKFYLKCFSDNIINSFLVTYAVCDLLKISDESLQEAFTSFALPPLRMERIVLDDYTVIGDCYNSNPTSCESALRQFSRILHPARKVIILGSMLELGTFSRGFHSKIIELAVSLGFKDLLLVGKEFSSVKDDFPWFESVEDLLQFVNGYLLPNDLILVKGSRVMQLEKVIHLLSRGKFNPEVFVKKNSLLEV